MKFFLSLFLGILFFISGFLTLGNYGISWDEPTHFKRGQGYLWYLLTGDNTYQKLPPYDLLRAQNDSSYHERSIYQDDKHNAAFYRTIDGTHPPLADILSSSTNMVFYQRLGILGDIESYHLFEIFVASIGVAVLFLFVYESFGLIAAFFSTIIFATYPLFWAESHFNIKDPIETSWIILTLYFLWKGIKSSSARFILISSVFAGFALATKFNVIFLPLIVLPWLFFVFKTHKKEFLSFVKTRRFLLLIFLYPIIVFTIFYVSYPFLWDSPIANIGKVLTYYQRNALDPTFANAVLPSWPFYAIRWVILTAPPLVLLGLILSLVFLKKNLTKYHGFFLLVLLWFLVPVLRVSIPGVNIYGGVRQIMEYIPAIAILAGVGIGKMVTWLHGYMVKLKKPYNYLAIQPLTLLVIFTFSIYPLIRLHPNENVYFNFLIGGLKGAAESGVPAAGNSFGNAYYQGAMWINENAIQDAKLTLIQGSSVNIPKYKLRSDINLSDDYFSGINRDGEYLMALTYNYEHKENFYAWEYVERFLEPIYEVKADNVPILKIWKNDLEHTKPEYRFEEKSFNGKIVTEQKNQMIMFKTEKEVLLSRLILSYEPVNGCSLPRASVIDTSLDGQTWFREKDPLAFSQVGKKSSSFKPAWADFSSESLYSSVVNGNMIQRSETVFYFAARKAKFIRLNLDNEQSCILHNPLAMIEHLVPHTGNED